MRDESLFCFFAHIFQRNTAMLSVIAEIIVASVGYPPELFSSKRIIKFKINRPLAIVSSVVLGDFRLMNAPNAQSFSEFKHCHSPLFKRFPPIGFSHEILNLHLLKFSFSEKEISWSNLISECLANLRHSERKFRMK